MRVVSGEARGRRLVAPPGRGTRPTTDRVREAVFNALASLGAIEGAAVLDLFAGSGALGIEALSRGAARATFVESDRAALDTVRANLRSTGLTDRAVVVTGAAEAFLARSGPGGAGDGGFDLVLLDPPYATDEPGWADLLGKVGEVAPEATVVVESDRAVPLPPGWHALREKQYGGTLVVIARPPSRPSEPL